MSSYCIVSVAAAASATAAACSRLLRDASETPPPPQSARAPALRAGQATPQPCPSPHPVCMADRVNFGRQDACANWELIALRSLRGLITFPFSLHPGPSPGHTHPAALSTWPRFRSGSPPGLPVLVLLVVTFGHVQHQIVIHFQALFGAWRRFGTSFDTGAPRHPRHCRPASRE